MTRVLMIAAGLVAAFLTTGVLLGGWFLLAAGASDGQNCAAGTLDSRTTPEELVPLFERAAVAYDLGPQGPAILAGLTSVESDFGRNMGPSSAGAVGWTQFLPATWQRYGVDADSDGRSDPLNAADAITSAANYLRHLGAPANWRRALFGYNHSHAYVDEVLRRARALGRTAAGEELDSLGCSTTVESSAEQTTRVFGGGRIVAIPGQPGQSVDERILRDVQTLIARYGVRVTAGYAPTGHKSRGEHPLGLALDLVPGPSATWDDVDALARWAEPAANKPRRPFRWVGYDGDGGHGRGHHLHLSWQHGPTPTHAPPAPWVLTFTEA